MNTVYVVQRPAYFDKTKRGWVSKYDISKARRFGEFNYLLHPGNIFRDKLEDAVARLERELANYSDGDHILAAGDPIAIAIAVHIAMKNNSGKVSVLKYDRVEEDYTPFTISVQQ